MLVVVIGATGLIGKELVNSLLKDGYEVKVLSRSKSKAEAVFKNQVAHIEWNGKDVHKLTSILTGVDVVINLAGQNIAVPWTKSNKYKIWKSRVNTTETITKAINGCISPPRILIQASAVGYYSYNSMDCLNEYSPKGTGFLSDLTAEWERQAMLCSLETRVVVIRTGIVLASNGGFLSKILKPLKLYAGTILGSGKQIIPWIHIDDHISAVKFLIGKSDAKGTFNLVAPNPVSFSNLTKLIAGRVQRPVLFRIPSFLLRIALGSMANEVLLANQNVEPKRLKELGFEWRFPEIDDALGELCKQP